MAVQRLCHLMIACHIHDVYRLPSAMQCQDSSLRAKSLEQLKTGLPYCFRKSQEVTALAVYGLSSRFASVTSAPRHNCVYGSDISFWLSQAASYRKICQPCGLWWTLVDIQLCPHQLLQLVECRRRRYVYIVDSGHETSRMHAHYLELIDPL